MQTLGSRQASNTFGSLLNTVQHGESVKVTRNRKDVAVVLSIEDCELLGGEQIRLHKRSELLEKKRQMLLAELQQDVDDLIKYLSSYSGLKTNTTTIKATMIQLNQLTRLRNLISRLLPPQAIGRLLKFA